MKRTMVAIVVAQLATAAALYAQTPANLPSGRDLLIKSLHATGADSMMKKHTSMKMTGTLGLPEQGITAPLENSRSSIGAFYLLINFEGMGTIEQGYTNGTAWSVNFQTGPSILEGSAAALYKRQAMWSDSPDNYLSMTNEGITKFQDKDAYKVLFVAKDSMKMTRYFDPATGLAVGAETTADLGAGVSTTITTMSDYKNFGGLLFPVKQVQMVNGTEQDVTIEKIEFDNVPASVFALPAAIVALKK
jgi:hypothetical protein